MFYGKASNGKGGAADGESRRRSLVHGSDTGVENCGKSATATACRRGPCCNAGYVKINNDCSAKYTFNINAYAIAAGRRAASAFVFGIVHFF